jgi:16S rRNA (guanine527-N7)-methyltransferase
MDTILKYYPDISSIQQSQFTSLFELYKEWNEQINVISRKDIDNLYEHHVLHSLSIKEVINFRPGSSVLDLGCGGGFPGIPLAIMFPDVDFHLVDSVGKKLKVASSVSESIGLQNVRFSHCRGEELKGYTYDFVVSRAAMSLPALVRCVGKNIKPTQHNVLPNGILALKGGSLDTELREIRRLCTIWDISSFYSEPYFSEKKIVHVTIKNKNNK